MSTEWYWGNEDVVYLGFEYFSELNNSGGKILFTPNITLFNMANHLKEFICLNTFSHLLKAASYPVLHIPTNNQL